MENQPNELDFIKEIKKGYQASEKEKAEKDDLRLEETALTTEQLLALNVPPPQWLLNAMIPHPGLVAISGKPGSYKTFFAMWMAQRIAAGKSLFDHFDEPFFVQPEPTDEEKVSNAKTLFIEEEMTKGQIKKRIADMLSFAKDRTYWLVGENVNLNPENESHSNQIADFCKQKDIKVIFLDPFTSVMQMTDENANGEANKLMDWIRDTFVHQGISVVFIHHPSKGDSGGMNLRGAGDILGKCDMHFVLEKQEGSERRIKITYAKCRSVDEMLVSDFQARLIANDLMGHLEWQYIGKVEKEKKDYEKERDVKASSILSIMMPGISYLQKEIAIKLGMNKNGRGFLTVWKGLLEEGKIVKNDEDGSYQNIG